MIVIIMYYVMYILNQDGYSPCYIALHYGNFDLFQTLLSKGLCMIEIRGVSFNYFTIYHYLFIFIVLYASCENLYSNKRYIIENSYYIL